MEVCSHGGGEMNGVRLEEGRLSNHMSAEICLCVCARGVQALGYGKRLETILLFWCNINTIELNRICNMFYHI